MNVGLHFRVIIYSFAVSVQRVSLNLRFVAMGGDTSFWMNEITR